MDGQEASAAPYRPTQHKTVILQQNAKMRPRFAAILPPKVL